MTTINRAPNRVHLCRISMYGYPDNGDSDAIAYPASGGYGNIHETAGGAGTWADPITFAAGEAFRRVYQVGTRIYVPYLQVYCMLEDDCSTCTTSFWWIKIWIGGQGYTTDEVDMQEMKHTRDSTTVIFNPTQPGQPKTAESAANVRRVERTSLMERE